MNTVSIIKPRKELTRVMRKESLSIWGLPVALLIFLVLAAALTRPLPWLALFALPGFVWLILRAVRSRQFNVLGAGMLLLLLPSIYILNASHQWGEGTGAVPVDHIGFLPATSFPAGSVNSLMFIFAAWVVVGLSVRLSRKQVEWVGMAIAGAGAVTALAVIGQRLSPRPYPVFELTGFFPYENHFAAFANLILPVILCWGARLKIRAHQSGKLSSPAGLMWWAAGLLVAAVVASGSRAGMVVSALILPAFAAQQLLLRRRVPLMLPPITPLLKFVTVSGILAAGAAGLIAVATRWVYLHRIGKEFSFRAQVLLDTADMWKDNLIWGAGPGSFAAVFPYYQSMPLDKFSFLHAHCEPLEFLAEWGLLGAGLVLTAAVWGLLSIRQNKEPAEQAPSFVELEGVGLWMALVGILLHSLIDFPFRHPLIALLTVVWIGILTGHTERKKERLSCLRQIRWGGKPETRKT